MPTPFFPKAYNYDVYFERTKDHKCRLLIQQPDDVVKNKINLWSIDIRFNPQDPSFDVNVTLNEETEAKAGKQFIDALLAKRPDDYPDCSSWNTGQYDNKGEGEWYLKSDYHTVSSEDVLQVVKDCAECFLAIDEFYITSKSKEALLKALSELGIELQQNAAEEPAMTC